MTGNTYRGGKIHVLSRMCDTCIFRKGGFHGLAEGRVEQMVADAGEDTAITCHETYDIDNAVCRGFYGAHRNQVLQIATRLGVVAFDDPPTKGDTPC